MTKTIKKLSGLMLAFAVAASGLTAPAANALPPQTDVTGVVTENGAAVPGAMVTVECKGHTATDTTDANGSYLVEFAAGDCPFGATVKVTAKKGGMSGTSSGTVHGITTKLNIAVVNVAIPEYGLIGGVLAGVAGIGAIALYRRRLDEQGMGV